MFDHHDRFNHHICKRQALGSYPTHGLIFSLSIPSLAHNVSVKPVLETDNTLQQISTYLFIIRSVVALHRLCSIYAINIWVTKIGFRERKTE